MLLLALALLYVLVLSLHFYHFFRLSLCPRGKLLLHDTKVLHITVRKVCHAVCPKAILDLNGNWGNGKRDGLRGESQQ